MANLEGPRRFLEASRWCPTAVILSALRESNVRRSLVSVQAPTSDLPDGKCGSDDCQRATALEARALSASPADAETAAGVLRLREPERVRRSRPDREAADAVGEYVLPTFADNRNFASGLT
jgi:hypothetical protein